MASSEGQPAKKRPARSLLLEAAASLFYSEGVVATGIDAITAAAGVAKKSLYNNFASKADLVAAYLAARHEEWLGLYRARVAVAATPRERVLAVFDAYIDHANFAYERGFRGCGLLNAAAELPAGAPGRLAVRQHKEEIEGLLLKHVAELLPPQDKAAAGVARHLAFLLEGSMARAGLEGEDGCLQEARMIAAQMLEEL
ncbi:TetR/AcrR family transcriptional regulator [Arthrobacter sp. ISL-65]|uniref:TetR/AcrR family transcriptional regulator n=1 Tax=Arthrobacter sp. ISL-65 TaxID=2819112 RepID=UPI001BECA1CB|nr:TetR/AcrR family transcriptional regulator [Arthrobacter sp. ISL-65]MBT2548822.1 TetR/AcrR family transcriptional regulator [Arthrobacter sp. ISL-65]